MSLETERRVIPFYNRYQMTRARQLYESAQHHKIEENEYRKRGYHVRDYIDNYNQRITQPIDAQFLFGWWLVLKSLASEMDGGEAIMERAEGNIEQKVGIEIFERGIR